MPETIHPETPSETIGRMLDTDTFVSIMRMLIGEGQAFQYMGDGRLIIYAGTANRALELIKIVHRRHKKWPTVCAAGKNFMPHEIYYDMEGM